MQMDGVGKRPGSSLAVELGTWKCLASLGSAKPLTEVAVPQEIHSGVKPLLGRC